MIWAMLGCCAGLLLTEMDLEDGRWASLLQVSEESRQHCVRDTWRGDTWMELQPVSICDEPQATRWHFQYLLW